MLYCEHAVLEVVCNSDCGGRQTPCQFGHSICCGFCEHNETCKDACAAVKIAGWLVKTPEIIRNVG